MKRQGLTAVLSVQHPAVVPFEPEGIAWGKARALPWPLTVIAPSTPPEGDTAVAAAFRRAWQVIP